MALADFNSPDYWEQALADIQAGRTPGVTPRVDPSQIPSFGSWMSPERQAYYGNFPSAGNILRPDQRAAATAAGVNPSTDNAPQYDYLKQFYDLPSYAGKDPLNYLPIVLAAAGGLGAAGAFGGAATGAAAAPTAAGTLEGAAAVAPEFGLGGGATGYGLGGTAAVPAATGIGGAGTGAMAGAAAGSTPLGRLLGLGQTGSDLLSVGGALAPGVLGYFGANKASDAYRDVANQNLALGAPYRETLSASYQPGFDLMSQPGYGDAFNRIADISARGYSAKFGNPAGSPAAQAGILSDVWNQGYLPALSNYRGQLGQFSGFGLNTAGNAQLGGANIAGGQYDALGLGLGRAMNPQPSIEDLLRQANRLSIGGRTYG